MKILVVADQEAPYFWDYFDKSKLDGIDLILSCGDLHPHYLSFLATFFQGPILYVHGNHDDRYRETPPEGCIDIDGKLYVHEGIRILGLGGSMRYKPGPHQYTEREMRLRVLRLLPGIWRHKGFDILLTHSPAYELGDTEDLPHRGFQIYRWLMEKYSPKYMVHGHVHMTYSYQTRRRMKYQETTIINGFERYVLEY